MGRIKKHFGILFIFLVSLLPLTNLLTPGLPITHDSLEHTARIASFYQSLSEGNLIPRWAGNLNWGYGHPILMFLYPLPEYLATGLHFLGFTFSDSFKLLMGLSYTFSGIFMYLWIKKFLNEKAAIAGAVIYLYAPYRFIDLYVRGALGEHVAFMFIPLVLLAILNINQIPKNINIKIIYLYILIAAFSIAGLILSHNAISLIFMPFILFYSLYLYIENKSIKKLLATFISVILGFLISFFFWFPALIEGKYTLRDIVTKGAYADRFIEIKDLVYGNWNYGGSNEFTVQIGLIALLVSLLSIFLFYKFYCEKNAKKYLLIICYLFLTISIFLMIKESAPVWEKVTTLQKFQFPWRFLSISIFSTSVICALFVSELNKKIQKYVLIIIILAAIIPTMGYWHARDYKVNSDAYYVNNYNGTTDTGESSPIWSIRFMEKKPNKHIELISGKATIKTISRSTTMHEYEIKNTEKIRIKENTLYFPGWKVYDNNVLVTDVEFQDPKNRGIITFYLNPGNHNVKLIFENTKIRLISEYVSLISLTILILISIPVILSSSFSKNIKL